MPAPHSFSRLFGGADGYWPDASARVYTVSANVVKITIFTPRMITSEKVLSP